MEVRCIGAASSQSARQFIGIDTRKPPLLYHFAFTIPLNTWQQAKTWLKARTPLLRGHLAHWRDRPGRRAVVNRLKSSLGVEVFRDSSFEDFAQLGDINGVLVLSKRGRLWFPDQCQPALVSPLRISLLGTLPQQITLGPYPYMLEVVPLTPAE